jgi:hypothetical protein
MSYVADLARLGILPAQHYDQNDPSWPYGTRLQTYKVRVVGKDVDDTADTTYLLADGVTNPLPTLGPDHGGFVWLAADHPDPDGFTRNVPLWSYAFPGEIQSDLSGTDSYQPHYESPLAVRPAFRRRSGGTTGGAQADQSGLGWDLDEGLLPQLAAPPRGMDALPDGFPVLAVPLSTPNEQQVAVLPSGNLLAAIWHGGAKDGKFGTFVYDTTNGRLDASRKARLHSFLRVYRRPQGGLLSFGPQDPSAPADLAWQLGYDVDGHAGLGVVVDRVPGGSGAGPSGTPPPPSNRTPTGSGTHGDPAGTPVNLGAGANPITLGSTIAQLTAQLAVNSAQLAAARAAGSAGAAATGTLQDQRKQIQAAIASLQHTQSASPGAGSTTGMSSVFGVGSKTGFGIFSVGEDGDKHELARTPDGEAANSLHLNVLAPWDGDGNDAPVECDPVPYQTPTAYGPFVAPVFFRYDGGSSHPFVGGTRPGLRRWEALVPFDYPPPPVIDGTVPGNNEGSKDPATDNGKTPGVEGTNTSPLVIGEPSDGKVPSSDGGGNTTSPLILGETTGGGPFTFVSERTDGGKGGGTRTRIGEPTGAHQDPPVESLPGVLEFDESSRTSPGRTEGEGLRPGGGGGKPGSGGKPGGFTIPGFETGSGGKTTDPEADTFDTIVAQEATVVDGGGAQAPSSGLQPFGLGLLETLFQDGAVQDVSRIVAQVRAEGALLADRTFVRTSAELAAPALLAYAQSIDGPDLRGRSGTLSAEQFATYNATPVSAVLGSVANQRAGARQVLAGSSQYLGGVGDGGGFALHPATADTVAIAQGDQPPFEDLPDTYMWAATQAASFAVADYNESGEPTDGYVWGRGSNTTCSIDWFDSNGGTGEGGLGALPPAIYFDSGQSVVDPPPACQIWGYQVVCVGDTTNGQGAAGTVFVNDGTNTAPGGTWQPYSGAGSSYTKASAATAAFNTTETIVGQSSAIPANTLVVGSLIRVTLGFSILVSSGAPSLTFRLRFGTAGTTADTLVASQTFVSATLGGATNYFQIEFLVRVTTAGATGALAGHVVGTGDGLNAGGNANPLTIPSNSLNTTLSNAYLSASAVSANANATMTPLGACTVEIVKV